MGFIIPSWIHGLQASVVEQWTDNTDNLQMGSYEIYEKKKLFDNGNTNIKYV